MIFNVQEVKIQDQVTIVITMTNGDRQDKKTLAHWTKLLVLIPFQIMNKWIIYILGKRGSHAQHCFF